MQMDVKCTTFDEHDPVPEDVPLLVDPSVWGLTLVDHCHRSSSQSPAAGSGWPLSGRHQPAASPSRALNHLYLHRLYGMGLGHHVAQAVTYCILGLTLVPSTS